MYQLDEHIKHASGRRKTVCTSAVIGFFGIHPDEYHYSQNDDDVKRILRRRGLSVRSRKSKVRGMTVGAARKAIRALNDAPGSFYYVGVPGHAMLLDENGKTVVDTDPRKRDVRKVQHCSIVEGYPKILARRRETQRRIDLDRGFSPRFAGMTMGEIKEEDFDDFVAELRIVEKGGRVLAYSKG